MFVVAPVSQTFKPDSQERTKFWPIVFEDPETGRTSSIIAKRSSRESAQETADALNGALDATA